ncbi:MAG: WYL domain-containing protein [Coriobacteriia bacterium]|nr:WYL domain-containing protein [Coriobacteriia bacterium]
MHRNSKNVRWRAAVIIDILSALKPGAAIDIEDLAKITKSNPTLLKKDLAILADCGIGPYYIDITVEADGTVRLLRPPVSLNKSLRLADEQMLALALSLKMAGIDEDDPLFEKINAAFGGTWNEEFLRHRILIHPVSHSFSVFEALALALQTSLPAEIDYSNLKGESTTRITDVARMTNDRDGWYIHGYCHSAHETRTFKLDRISDVRIQWLSDKAKGKNNLDTPESVIDALGREVEQHRKHATLVFADAQSYVPRDWPLASEPKHLVNGGIRIEIPLISNDWIAKKVMGFGGKVSVKSPEHLRAYVKETARSLQKALR